MPSITKSKTAIGSVVVTLCSASVAAQTLEIAPITIDLPTGRLASTIGVINRGDQPTRIQVRPFAWSQVNGEDRLRATADLLVSPPFSTLNTGEAQTIRVVLRNAATDREQAYRLLIDQLPSAAVPGSVRLALRVSLPVFAAPVGTPHPALSWRLAGDAVGKTTLIVRNDGNCRARLSNLMLSGRGMAAEAPGFTFRYVLAGSEAAIPVEIRRSTASSSALTIHVTATSDQGKVETDVPVAPAG